MTAAEYLRGRADSYSRDAVVLYGDGDRTTALAYRTIVRELRYCADQIDADVLSGRTVPALASGRAGSCEETAAVTRPDTPPGKETTR